MNRRRSWPDMGKTFERSDDDFIYVESSPESVSDTRCGAKTGAKLSHSGSKVGYCIQVI